MEKQKPNQKKICHDYYLKGTCDKTDCQFYHSIPKYTCIYQEKGQVCKFCSNISQPTNNNGDRNQQRNNQKFAQRPASSQKREGSHNKRFDQRPATGQRREGSQQKVRKCHTYHLLGNCEKNSKGECNFDHNGQPLFKCIMPDQKACVICPKMKQKQPLPKKSEPKKCHEYHLKGNCLKPDCKYDHSGNPSYQCVSKDSDNCQFCRIKVYIKTSNGDKQICHDYHLSGNCKNQSKCRFDHSLPPYLKCIFGIACLTCNNDCHQYHLKGKCKRYKCKFSHEKPCLNKCPFGKVKCAICNFRREKNGPCHNYHVSKCHQRQQCNFSHKGKPNGSCINFFCKHKECLSSYGRNKDYEKAKKVRDEIIKPIIEDINEREVFPDSLKAAELIQDQILFQKNIKNIAKNIENISFVDKEYDQNDPVSSLIAVRQTMKQALGFNYVTTKEVENVQVQSGIGTFISKNGDEGIIQIQKNQSIIKVQGQEKSIQNSELLVCSVLSRKSSYYDQSINNSLIRNNEEFKIDEPNQKKKENKQQLKEIHLMFSPSINVPIIGEFNVIRQQSNKIFNFKSTEKAKNILEQNLNRIKQESKQQNSKNLLRCSLEICFLIDATASMDHYIEESKKSMQDIIQQIQQRIPTKFDISYGVVVYRDHCDSDLTEIFRFSKDNYLQCITFISKIKAHGGGDPPEAVIDGVNEAIKLNWDNNSHSLGGNQKIIFHIADAPPHGKEYSEFGDDYPQGCPCNLKWKDMFEKLNHKEISYNMLAIKPSLNKTIRNFERNLQSFDYRNIQDHHQQTEEIVDMIKKYPWWNIRVG